MSFSAEQWQPLAARMRPRSVDELIGQKHLLAPGKPLYEAITHAHVHSMILWGPPGSGKTTLAHLLAAAGEAELIALSAVMSGVKDIRQAVEQAQKTRQQSGKKTILFIDEVHRFNKAQQDAFLPYVENGTLILIGATTENPSFELNSALLSRARVYVLKRLQENEILQVIDHCLQDKRGLAAEHLQIPPELREQLAAAADGDGRRALNLLEILNQLAQAQGIKEITAELVTEVLTDTPRLFDKYGEAFYDQISALHKSVRGSAPDAALYWFARMIDGGCDPLYIARRVVRMASEDIGNADPRALDIALHAWDVQQRLGSPEGELTLAQAIIYLSCAAKSNAVYTAYNAVLQDVKQYGSLPVPLHLRNAPTKLMKALDYGKHYRYAHDEPNAYAAGENYFPDDMPQRRYYQPVDRGLEIKIKEKLAALREADKQRK